MSNENEVKTPVVTFSNIPLDDEPSAIGFDRLPPEAFLPQTVTVVDIQFKKGGKVYYFDPGSLTVNAGDDVIIDTARGAEYGFCAGGNHQVEPDKVVQPLRSVIRVATDHDKRIRQEYKAKEEAAFDQCQQKIESHGLDMQLVSAEYAFDGSKILFFFTADERVDFRELVKNLASVFHTRIELRQIGVRDKAKMVGGLGICGRPFCCASFLDDFQPVSIKMAKTQNLSLNPSKISGTCGRLMCCLKYEQDAYEDLIRTSPKMDSFVDTPEGRGTVVEIDLLRQRVKVRMEDAPETISVFPNTDIAILRNGKAKKNDPPIPADLAPISGNGKRVRKEESEEKLLLEPIRFKYSTEKIVEEPQILPEETAASEEESQPSRSSRSRRRRNRGQGEQNKGEQAQTDAPSKSQSDAPQREKKEPRQNKAPREPRESGAAKPSAPETKDAPAEQAKKPHRRPNHRRHRKPKPQAEG